MDATTTNQSKYRRSDKEEEDWIAAKSARADLEATISNRGREEVARLESARREFEASRERKKAVARWARDLKLGTPGVGEAEATAATEGLAETAEHSDAARADVLGSGAVPSLLELDAPAPAEDEGVPYD